MMYVITLIILTGIGIYLLWQILILVNKLESKALTWVERTNYKYLTERNMEKLPQKWSIKLTKDNYKDYVKYSGWTFSFRDEEFTLHPKYGTSDKTHFTTLSYLEEFPEISFENFKKLVLKENVIPEYVECIKQQSSYGVVGNIYKVRTKNSEDWCVETNIQISSFKPGDIMYFPLERFFKPSTKEAYEAQLKPKEPELIEGNWYNIQDGTFAWNARHYFDKVRLATSEEIAKVTDKKEESLIGRYYKRLDYSVASCEINNYLKVISETENYFRLEKYGNVNKDDQNHWELQPKGFIPPQKEQPMNTYGLKVGDKLPEKVLHEWCKLPNNVRATNKNWISGRHFTTEVNREIKLFKSFEGKTIMWLSNCEDEFCVKAEGFKEFMDNFDKPKAVEPMKQELTSLPEKWCIICEEKYRLDFIKLLKEKDGSSLGFDIYGWFYHFTKLQYNNHCKNKIDGYTEITFEQFKKWVLKENSIFPVEKIEKQLQSLKEDKPKFEVGKWYLYTHPQGPFYMKCSKESSDGTLHYSDYINAKTKKFIKNANSSCKNEYVINIEVSPSEIQQYLPDSHVDKIKTEKVMDMKEIQEECKRRFPIGSVVSNTKGKTITLVEDFDLYKINRQYIWASSGQGCLYDHGEYATLISLPEKKYDYEIVHCTTQEEWDFVYNKLRSVNNVKFKIDRDTKGAADCINIKEMGWGSYEWYKQYSTKIYSFSEWCDKFNHKPDFMEPKSKSLVGRYLKALRDNAQGTDLKVGEYGKIYKDELTRGDLQPLNRNISYGFCKVDFGKEWELMPEEFIPPSKELSKEELLAEAKRRYPVGAEIISKPQSIIYGTAESILRDNFTLQTWAHYQYLPSISYNSNKQHKKGWIDPSVQTVKSITVPLVQKRKVTYF